MSDVFIGMLSVIMCILAWDWRRRFFAQQTQIDTLTCELEKVKRKLEQ